MNDKLYDLPEVRAEKFQRLTLGVILFVAYVIQSSWPVLFVAAVMALACFASARFTPFYRLHFWWTKAEPALHLPADYSRGSRFACSLGFLFLAGALFLFQRGIPDIAWLLVLLVAILSTLAGTVGFCLGSVIYMKLFTRG